MLRTIVALALLLLAACSSSPSAPDAGSPADASEVDASLPDAGPVAACDRGELPAFAERRSDARFLLRCGESTLEVTAFDEGTLRLRYQGEGKPERSYAVVGAPAQVAVRAGKDDEGAFALCSGAFELTVTPDCRVLATQAGGSIVVEDPAGGGYFEDGESRGVLRTLHAGEHFYGFGEKTGPLDKRGQSFQMRNTDCFNNEWEGFAPGTDPLYQSVPFFVGLAGSTAYGVFTDDSWRTSFDMGASEPERYEIRADGGVIDQYLFAGPTFPDVLRRYTALTGRMPLPPRWTLGYHQSRWGYSLDDVRRVSSELRRRRIPTDGFWLDIQHMERFKSFTWDPAGFPDPAGLVAELEAQGFKTTVIVDPGIRVEPGWSIYDDGVAYGHFLKDANGQPFVGEVWPGAAVFPDFSAPATREWWKGLLTPNVQRGIRGLWIDMNEPASFVVDDGRTVPDRIAAAGDGVPTTMAEIHNVYGLAEAKATWEGMKAAAPNRRPFVLTRAGYAGEQRYVAVWTGDAPSSWPTLQETVPMMLNLGVSGVPFVGSDVGGYSGRATGELFARWMQVGFFSPFMRGHTQTTGAAQEPWVFGTEVEDVSRAQIQERYELLPYAYSLFREASLTGTPMLRPVVWEFPADERAHTLGDQVMLGPWMLVAPVIEEGASKRAVYLPAGRWFEATSGAVREGPTTFEQAINVPDHPAVLAARPTFVREGAIIPRAEFTQWVGERQLQLLQLDVYPAARETRFTLYEDDGETFDHEAGEYSAITYSLQRTATGATISASAREGSFTPPSRTLLVRVRRVDHAPTAMQLDGQPLTTQTSEAALRSAGRGWFWDEADRSLLVAFPDRAGFALTMSYDPALDEAGATVPVAFEVTVPANTTASDSICVASSANGWAQQPLGWAEPGRIARGTLPVPRGEWFAYKFTRCSWESVEKWDGCAEAKNRYGFGAAHPTRTETVALWADRCAK